MVKITKTIMIYSISQLLKWWNSKYFISSPIMDFWNKETLNCSRNSNLKVHFAGNGRERLFIFVQWKVYENSWHTERFKMISVGHMYSLNLTRGTKLTELNTKKNLQIGFFSKMVVLCKWEQVTLFCCGHYIMSVTETVLFFCFLWN